ncbi:mannitol dehydrogenase family protein [Microbacterium sp. APC 3901]|uniref:mannitol dehydrogenase family protein n=1 Tax=Microbacterium sp. APC 3901 TaxID=3035192 RepID=UPI0025B35CD4|nr:mannitol dehydrogenase family protein [Microbacterium sp. APC 3901]MDN3444132.1 mannitol dehydrogenase family protein [Microbacterium sp. APC 3901]
MGLGAFHRSHLAWYTAHASDAEQWGIAAYTGRSAGLADDLSAQDGLYTLVVRSPAGDEAERVGSIVRAHPGTDIPSFVNDLAALETAIVSLTITEAAYADERTSLDRTLLAGSADADLDGLRPLTAIGRLVLGLEARRRADSGALALVSCDNLPENGGVLRQAVHAVAIEVPGLVDWIDAHVSFVSSSVDRITPRLSDEEAAELAERYGDRAPVVAEPFSDWVIAGEFPGGRPQWETAGARFADELEPWEARKLWLLNGAHTLLASLGRLRGHRTVSEAIADADCLRSVEAYWDEACRHLPPELELPEYRAALLERFRNPRIRHLLAQIGLDADTKMRVRIAPVAERERSAGRSADACAKVVAAWLAVDGPGTDRSSVECAIVDLSPVLGVDAAFVEAVLASRRSIGDLTLR